MGRALRVDNADQIYHVINRSNGRIKIFHKQKDYLAFENIMADALELFKIRLYSFEIMPNHWHLVISPEVDGEMSRFVGWLTLTHTQRYHAHKGTTGNGHLYQGRYKSFIVEKESYFYTLCRYVERNAVRAGLVRKATDWRWGSAWVRKFGTLKQKKMLTVCPDGLPDNYDDSLNESDESDNSKTELETIRRSVNKGNPLGKREWVAQVVARFGLISTTRPRGRPRVRFK
ncbi:MAG: hypothetical protein COV07_04360 [Candidatus Vogelbacteria bacterium CG10_big_fil_rev_8_21_14_0_10_45_14]|uniref:Transposase IS200-like domain-containing protein n=1 Tax=Candidatus Vogelbacteria bacterium CG10_big_fil_rev_8_21_14_0_10_45_14 TaxID=1975042 RepID=A0A2H0RII2_9BACT|nr:MAG: hypothetical protein COV07_04360 [Candidatus Vogelbacteria bacterium CG10_big_fil_rev_8_21_14_0_10_45_14]